MVVITSHTEWEYKTFNCLGLLKIHNRHTNDEWLNCQYIALNIQHTGNAARS